MFASQWRRSDIWQRLRQAVRLRQGQLRRRLNEMRTIERRLRALPLQQSKIDRGRLPADWMHSRCAPDTSGWTSARVSQLDGSTRPPSLAGRRASRCCHTVPVEAPAAHQQVYGCVLIPTVEHFC